MRISRSAALLLVTCALGLTACGGSDDEESSAITTMPTAPAPATSGTPDDSGTTTSDGTATATAPTSTAPGDGEAAQSGTSDGDATDADGVAPSGGVSPSSGSSDSEGTAGGVQPTITPGTADEPASAITDDPALIDLWCEQARQGAYDDQVGEATTLAITVRGSDDTRTCELPR
jgi:hypothetical protein